jgi:opacity protein-like surface antigen
MMRLPKWLEVIIVKRILETMKRTILASIFGALSLNAFAASPSYDFVKAGYVQADIEDAGDFEPTGFQIQGFKSLNENVYLTGRYGQLSEDVSGVDIDLDYVSAGVGYRYGLTQNTDFFGEVTYEYVNLDIELDSISGEDDNGYGITAGIRSMLSEQFELRGAIRYIDIEEDETAFEIGADYFFTPQFSFGATYVIADDVDLLGVSARYTF